MKSTEKAKSAEAKRYVPPARRSNKPKDKKVAVKSDSECLDAGEVPFQRKVETLRDVLPFVNIKGLSINEDLDEKQESKLPDSENKKTSAGTWAPYVPPSRRSAEAEAVTKSLLEAIQKPPKSVSKAVSLSDSELKTGRKVVIDSSGNGNVTISMPTSSQPSHRQAASVSASVSESESESEGVNKGAPSSSSSKAPTQWAGPYVPPGRRQQAEERQKTNQNHNEQQSDRKGRSSTSTSSSSSSRRVDYSWEDSATSTSFLADEERYVPPALILEDSSLRKCSIVVRGFPADLPEFSKEAMLQPFIERGAAIRWISAVEAVLVLPTEGAVGAARAVPHNSLLSIHSIEELEEDEAKSFSKVTAEMLESLKPERDARVANRMIGAALGIAIPRRGPIASGGTSTNAAAKKSRQSSPPKQDAWDD